MKQLTLIGCLLALGSPTSEALNHSKMKGSEVENRIANSYIVVLDGAHLSQSLDKSGLSKAQQIEATTMELLSGHNVNADRTYNNIVNGFALHEVNEKTMQAIADRDEVAAVYPNAWVEADASQFFPPSWGLDRVDQLDLPLNRRFNYSYNGSGVHVYVLDTGISHSQTNEFGNRILSHVNVSSGCSGGGSGACGSSSIAGQSIWSEIEGQELPPNWCESRDLDNDGHGTHVAGTIGSATYGVAKGVYLHDVKVLGCGLSGTLADVLEGMEWVVDNHQKPAVVNMSLGSGSRFPLLDKAVKELVHRDITVVVSAGNGNGDACTYSPAYTPEAITVANSTINDSRAFDSNHGRCVDLFAPGEEIISLHKNGGEEIKSGTSMSAPHVTGAVAMYLDRYPDATPNLVDRVLEATASKNRISDAKPYTPNHLLNTARLQATQYVPVPPDVMDNVNQRGVSDDGSRHAAILFGNGQTQSRSFHDPGDVDWNIFALGSGQAVRVVTSANSSLSINAQAMRLDGPLQMLSSTEFVFNELDLVNIGQTDNYGGGTLLIHNEGNETEIYFVKVHSPAQQFGVGKNYTINSTAVVIEPDYYDNLNGVRGYTDDKAGDAEPLYAGATPQQHNFHDSGDQDWTIFALGAGQSVGVESRPLGLATPRLALYRINGTLREVSPGRWFISNNMLQLVDQDYSGNNNQVYANNQSSEVEFYVVRAISSGPYGDNTEYTIRAF